MSAADIERQLKLLGVIRADLEQEAHDLDGLTFNGRTVAPILGRMLAAIDAVAMVVEKHIALDEATPRTWAANQIEPS